MAFSAALNRLAKGFIGLSVCGELRRLASSNTFAREPPSRPYYIDGAMMMMLMTTQPLFDRYANVSPRNNYVQPEEQDFMTTIRGSARGLLSSTKCQSSRCSRSVIYNRGKLCTCKSSESTSAQMMVFQNGFA